MVHKSIRNVLIIGGGPAGLSAALYTARANLSPLVLAGLPGGSQIALTSEIENFPGFEAVSGSMIIDKMRAQALKFGTEIVDEVVQKVDFSKKPFEIFTTMKKYQAYSVIIATGAQPRWLGIPSEERFKGKGVSVCATCDGFFFRNKTVVVVGGGNAALEETLQLAKIAAKVYVIHRRDEFRADKVLQSRVFKNKKIEVIWNCRIVEVLGTNRVEEIRVENTKDQALQNLKVDGLFVAIGRKPDTAIFKDQIDMDDNGYIDVEEGRSKTSVEGVFAAGDCTTPDYRQAGVAAGAGIIAALDAEKYLRDIVEY